MTADAPAKRPSRSLDDWRALFLEAAQEGLCAAQLARLTGASAVTIRKYRRLLGLELPNGGGPKGIDWKAVLKAAQTRNETMAAVAKRLDVHPTAVAIGCRKTGIALRPGSPAGRICADWTETLREAKAKGETQSELAQRLKVSRQAVSLACKREGVSLTRAR